ncbi:MAG: type II secretion system F family protein [Candidatus Cloacimonetes bacterium]|nr:type II secretion system F family protein [Candidatus Cloacimonadota bacterium]MCF7813654.1 type II secretion system F family protein [Candidatus Cloacimonadota bacterium]MCF7868333.1 type II secretion system F family protein [Candidatus Cloacimonadota bacterium]MCF7883807.1 type II secretion system F family protein [Candidatus Cloacimonadota bacterium]
MKNEYKYQGVMASGKGVQGVVIAKNKKKATELINRIANKYKIDIKSIKKKKLFLYTVKLPSGKKVKGRQQAYTKGEVMRALNSIGFQNAKIEPALIDIRLKPPFQSILMFVNLSSFLLKEKMSYDKILRMLADEESNVTLKETLRKIESELKKGKEGTEVFARYEDVFGKFIAYMLGLATKSGNMAEVYDATAKFMERDAEYRKSLKQALGQPAFMVIAMLLAVGYYVVKIFPETALMFVKFGIDLPPMTAATLDLSDWVAANWWWMFLLVLIPAAIIAFWWKTPKGEIWRDRFLIKLPVIGHLLHKGSIEIFFRVFGAIYSGSENNIETLTASAEACRNKYIEMGVKEIALPLMLKDGMPLVPALEKAEVFNASTLSRLKTGVESGNILQSAQQISTFYEKETSYKMQALIDSIQTFVGIFIAIVITMLTIVSSEIAMISPNTGP